MAGTALARQLAEGEPARRATAIDAFKLARRTFIAGERLEMQTLAVQLGVSRVTLHRWVGSRDQLLCEVLWSLGGPTLEDARAATRARGGKGVAETVTRFLRAVLTASFMREFLTREPEIALRVMTTAATDFQARMVDFVRDLLARETEAGRLEPPLDLDDLAWIIVRIAESFIYTDLITGGRPDPDKAQRAISALLR